MLHYEQLITLAKARGETLNEIVIFILQSSMVFVESVTLIGR